MVPWVSEAPLDFWRTNSGKRRSCNSAKPPTPTLILRGWKFWGLASSWQAGSHNFHCEFHIFSKSHRRNKSIQRKDSFEYINQIYKERKKWLYISQVGLGCNPWPLKTAEHLFFLLVQALSASTVPCRRLRRWSTCVLVMHPGRCSYLAFQSYWDSYEKLGLERDYFRRCLHLYHLSTGAGFRNHPQYGEIQTSAN